VNPINSEASRAGSATTTQHYGHGDQFAGPMIHDPGNNTASSGEDDDGASDPAVTAPGRYVAEELCPTLSQPVRRALEQVTVHVGVDDLVALGLISDAQRPTEGQVNDWSQRNLSKPHDSYAEVLPLAELRAVVSGHNPNDRYPLTAVADRTETWAVKAVEHAKAENLDRSVRDKASSFTAATLMACGATSDDIAALTKMRTDTRLASLRLLKEWEAAEYRQAQDAARQLLASAKAGELQLPPVVSLSDLLAEDDSDEVEMRIDNVMPAGGAKVLCVGQAGSGKTTLSGNLIRSLADGDPFLDAFTVHQRAERIVSFDMEMNTSMLRRWLRKQGIHNVGAVADVVTLRGRAGMFDMGNDRVREMWTRRLRDLGCDFVIFDCLKPVLESMGLDENRETGKFLYPFAEMLADAGVGDVLVHHHMGHTSERARGDSSMLGWSDANWKIVTQVHEVTGDKLRFFSTDKVRSAEHDVKEGLLTYTHANAHLTYAGGNRAQTKKDATVDDRVIRILGALADKRAQAEREGKGGADWEMTATDIRKAVGGKTEITNEALKKLDGEAAASTKPRATVRHATPHGRSRFYKITDHGKDPINTCDTGDSDTGRTVLQFPAGRRTAEGTVDAVES
jgi:hypothetical protein